MPGASEEGESTDEATEYPACVVAGPPSARAVFDVLRRADRDLRATEIGEHVDLSASGVKRGLSALDDCGVLASRPGVTDARKRFYELDVD